MTTIERVCALAIEMANDNSHGYSQYDRWGPDYDCSSLIIYLWTACGVDVKSRGATYTGNMYNAFLQAGFRKVNPAIEVLEAGDVLLNVTRHTALYIGDNKIVHAAGSETGGIHGKPGDQTGYEICIATYYDFPWDYVLRYEDPEQPVNNSPVHINYTDRACYNTKMPMISRGFIGPAIAAMQAALRYHGFYLDDEITGNFDAATETAVLDFQRKHKIEIDGICGPETWNELSFWR